MRISELAAELLLPHEGDGDLELSGLAGLADAGPGDLSFVTGAKYRGAFDGSAATAVLAPLDFDVKGRACIRSPQPYPDFVRAVEIFHPEIPVASGVHPTALIAPGVRLGADVSVGAYTVIGADVRIGARTRIDPHVTIHPASEIGEDCAIHSGAQIHSRVRIGNRVLICSAAVIGSPGFGFAFRNDGTRIRVPHRAGVVIEDDAEIGASSTIDASHPGHPHDEQGRASTRIGRGVKIDSQVHVAHGCEIGDGSTLCGGCCIAGGTRIGKNVFFAGLSATSGNLKVGEGTVVLGMSGVMNDTEPGSQLVGVPVMERRLFFRIVAASKRLPALLKSVARIEKHLGLD